LVPGDFVVMLSETDRALFAIRRVEAPCVYARNRKVPFGFAQGRLSTRDRAARKRSGPENQRGRSLRECDFIDFSQKPMLKTNGLAAIKRAKNQ
jgi:hypothetical protein